MSELQRTTIFCVVAAVLAASAAIVDPGRVTPEIFDDQGEAFFPDFTDPQAPKTIEVIDYDAATATARPWKVEFKDSKWSIPSHHSYPADAEERLAKTAAALIELRKDMIISDRAEDEGEYGVIDPLREGASSLAGRGKRVTLRDENGDALVDFVVGRKVPGKPGYRYMRVPSQKRIYAVKTDADISAKFEDWIETDLLKLSAADIRKVAINSYSINERMGRLENLEKVTLTKRKDQWRMSGGRTPNSDKMSDLTAALDDLRIVDVQPKPANLTRDLKTAKGITLSMESIASLRQKGFFIVRTGQLFSNEGEILVETANGLQYTLRFGEIASGGSSASAGEAGGSEPSQPDSKTGQQQERRYVFITVNHSAARAKKYADGKEPDDKGKDLARELRNRFADWYYVISGADFSKLRPSRRRLLKG